jgi:quinol monooxygenase YgiN
MVTKVAVIEVKQGMEMEFLAGVEKAMPFILRAEGCHGLSLERCIEIPEQFVLRVSWDTVEHNTELFVNSDDFKTWRKLVGHCFANKPKVNHTETLLMSGNQPV